MPKTRACRLGDSQAVRIPAEIAYDDVIVIAPARAPMPKVVARVRAASKPPPGETREPIEMPDRAWD